MAGFSTIVYLEMLNPPRADLISPDLSIACRHLYPILRDDYLQLYNRVGGEYQWQDRNRMLPDDLQRILDSPAVEVWLLLVDDRPAGYVEFDRRDPEQIEIVYFGLFPDFLGRGLGRYFLDWAVCQAWSYSPQRIWLHTCDRDHPAALPNYLRAGFSEYAREEKWEAD